MEDEEHASEPAVGRSVLLALAVGTAVAMAAIATVYAIIAIPLYFLASTSGDGLDKPLLRDGILHFGIPIGLLLGVATGAAVGVWYARGGRLPTDRTPW